MNTKITGLNQETFIQRTSAAFTNVVGNPLNHKGKLKRFIAEQFALQNDNQLDELFSKSSNSPKTLDLCSSETFHYFVGNGLFWEKSSSFSDAMERITEKTKDNCKSNPHMTAVKTVVYKVNAPISEKYRIYDYKPDGVESEFVFAFDIDIPTTSPLSTKDIVVHGSNLIIDDGNLLNKILVSGYIECLTNLDDDTVHDVTITIHGYTLEIDSPDDLVKAVSKYAKAFGIYEVKEIEII